ncbi:hypothetical protein CFAM422_011713 [Trichoderma lentiforme]|uniref:Uncharacterized protein n=1 Tax=Trichoderma lentiforme TaxID=1567552 RepID=A0A9P4X5D7_9HYPO|nr:hypothetical protein CFAM422_011713 [Trichoderma lentiforme]
MASDNNTAQEHERNVARLCAIMDELDATLDHTDCKITKEFRDVGPGESKIVADIWENWTLEERKRSLETLHKLQEFLNAFGGFDAYLVDSSSDAA